MKDRITKTDVVDKVEQLSKETDRDYRLDRWAPGDGWTRNQLLLKDEDGESFDQISNVLTTREMYQYIRGYLGIKKSLDVQ